MRTISFGYFATGLLMAGCSSAPDVSTDSRQTGSQLSALSAPGKPSRARSPRLGELDPESPRRAKGALLPTRKDTIASTTIPPPALMMPTRGNGSQLGSMAARPVADTR